MKFLINTLTSWDEAPRARHQVTRELLKLGHEVFFVEKNSLGFPRIDFKKEEENFTLIKTRFIPGYKFRFRLPIINELYQAWLFKKLKAQLGDMFVITFDFTAYTLTRFFSKYVYYCNDEVVGNTTVKSGLVDRYWKQCEKTVASRAKLCMATSQYLVKKLSNLNSNVFEIPLGGPDQVHIEVRDRNVQKDKIILGLVGFVREMTISTQVINELLKDDNYIIRLVGTVDEKFMSKIERPSGLELMGVLKGQALFDAIGLFDVAIAPYNLDKLNPGATSNKLHLQLACGVPVVMSALPNMKGQTFPEGTVYLSKDNKGFSALVKKALVQEKPEYVEIRKRVASENTWEMRVAEFIYILKDHGLYED